MTSVIVRGVRVPLLPKNTLGAGGEATVTLHVAGSERLAIKVFRMPTPDKARKIERLISLSGALPQSVVTPIAPAHDEATGAVVGYAMPALPSTFEPFAQLSSRAFRTARWIGKREVSRVLLALHRGLHAIHRAGAVVGDLNDQNELFARREIRFIDSDSFQLGELACDVSTEAFLDPLLYGPDLRTPCLTSGTPRVFSMASDWYAFAVLAFRAFTSVHPYGGTLPEFPTLALRARAKKSVFISDVSLPSAAREGIALLPRDLAGTFREIFEAGDRAPIPSEQIEAYEREIVRCSCGLDLPASLLPCPRCSSARVTFTDTARGIEATQLCGTRGTVLGLSARGATVYAIALEESGLVLYEVDGARTRSARLEIDHSRRGYEVLTSSRRAFVIPAGEMNGFEIDLETRRVTPRTIERGQGRAALAYAGSAVLRIAKGWVLSSSFGTGEGPVATVMEAQSWIAGSAGSELGVVSERFLGDRRYRVIAGRLSGELDVPPLDRGESLIEEELVASTSTVAVLQKTQQAGRPHVKTSLFRVGAGRDAPAVDVVAHCASDASLRASGETIARGLLVGERYIVATDHGLVREDLSGASAALELRATTPYVSEGSLLALSSRGLVAATGDRVFALKLNPP